MAGAHCFFIERGDPDTEEILVNALDEHGSREMAENYLYCDNPRLEEAGQLWAQTHSRTLEEKTDAPQWGSAQ